LARFGYVHTSECNMGSLTENALSWSAPVPDWRVPAAYVRQNAVKHEPHVAWRKIHTMRWVEALSAWLPAPVAYIRKVQTLAVKRRFLVAARLYLLRSF
jgi:hypothetical protein